MSSTYEDHVGDTPSTSDSKVHGQKGKVKLPCRLCEGNHPIHLCPYLDEAKKVLDNRPVSPQQLPSRNKKLSLNPSLVNKPTDQNQLSVKTTLSESESNESIPDPNEQVVEPQTCTSLHILSASFSYSFPYFATHSLHQIAKIIVF